MSQETSQAGLTPDKPNPINLPQPKIPPTFDRWFWTSDYRRGVTVLFDKLKAGLRESDELIGFVRKRALYERTYAHDLRQSISEPLHPNGFGYDDGASFLSAFHQLRSSQIDLSDAHTKLSHQLDRLVIGPFESWSIEHEARVTASFNQVESILIQWEKQSKEIIKLKERYEQKSREADEAEENSRLSPATRREMSSEMSATRKDDSSDLGDHSDYDDDTLIGRSGLLPGEGYAQIGKKVGEQAIGLGRAVSQRMRMGGGRVGFRVESVESQSKEESDNPIDTSSETKTSAQSKIDEEANETHESPSPFEWSRLFEQAQKTIYKQDVKIPLLGVYPGAHSGEDLVIYFKTNVTELSSSGRAIEFCKELSEELAVLRLIGEIGNKFMPTHDAFYLWKPEAFTLHQITPEPKLEDLTNTLADRRSLKAGSNLSNPSSPGHSKKSLSLSNIQSALLSPAGLSSNNNLNESGGPKGGAFAKYLQTAVSQAAKGINELSASVGVANPPISIESADETREERLRREADSAEKAYAAQVARLDHTRLILEQAISEHASFLQRCELNRLRAAKAVIMGFNAALGTLIPKMKKTAEESDVLNESFVPESDVAALVERYRTGPFRPSPVLFHSFKGLPDQVNFGIDLGRWYLSQDDQQVVVPPIFSRLLKTLEEKCNSIESHSERRKTWIYEVPLRAVHSLREALDNPNQSQISDERLSKLDAPLIASTIKLWLLELNPPPVHYSKYDDIKAIYPQLSGFESPSLDARIDVMVSLLSKLPKPHLMVIDQLVSHLSSLIKSTQTDESNEVFLTKLENSLVIWFSLGGAEGLGLIRPKVETAVTLSDRFQSLFLVDLVNHYDRILPKAISIRSELIEKTERSLPKRKHTRPVDMRMSRSGLGIEGSLTDSKAQEILETHRRRISRSGMVPASLPDEKETKEVVVSSPKPKESTPTEVISTKQVEPEGQSSVNDPIEPMMKKGPEVSEEEEGQSDRDEPFVSPREVEEGLIPSPEDHDDHEERDEGFVVPKSSSSSSEGDLPFVAPTEEKDLPFLPPRSEPEEEEGGGASGRAVGADQEDIPLSHQTLVSRWGSGKSSPRASLNRSRGVMKGSLGTNRPISISTSGGSGNGTDGGHKKASPSFDSIRSQFESKLENDGNRYRRATNTTGNHPKGNLNMNINRLSDVADE
ncbi:uncharacterized protein MELLADRAFT_77642 [Melampsora larici-populina 98AG31]|uniref:Rho-GAP domain-containing protein n=1 Tax=Melampsora larici-populina (strain 98AG31 / pathotype 3-4-7) TaxID=747676 RepID=F4RK45_MELLP|nr:uncharacterized protein MELLADRAFT_77642 [Melampsora larici-populina 98AG31]EGG07249.1 hypothetical protein MELLADRAFT_77642 [Melampsora larici-populina 98AG31]